MTVGRRGQRNGAGFTALSIAGNLFPSEFLQAIAAQSAKHQAPSEYGVSKSLNLKDEIARYWRIANDLYAGRKSDWLVLLLRNVFGYTDITPAAPEHFGERTFPVTHTAFDGAVRFVLSSPELSLDRADSRFGEAGIGRAPQNLLQEALNADGSRPWGIVANGTLLRLVRENPSLTRPAYLQAEISHIFDEELYADFATLWLAIHASRLAPHAGVAKDCILEEWRQQAQEIGERALEHLRDGVTEALLALGNGFLEHARNERLRIDISEGSLTAESFFQELLRLVYRLLFLFTVEDRGLLFAPSATEEQQAIYQEGYSVGRLREKALRRRHYDAYADLWEGLQVVFRGLGEAAVSLGLPSLGGLFFADQCKTLDSARIANGPMLRAVHALSYFRGAATSVRVNYRDMGAEELGSVYESLLEIHPYIDVNNVPWSLAFIGQSGSKAKGSARKLTGSYYTPAPLVNELIKSALEPLVSSAIAADDPCVALLGLRIIDPACGSGHFLLAAARRLAVELSRVQSGADEPDESNRQHALRQVVQHCIYGVDRNPLSVELCKAALWIETVEPGKPLTFLDPHIRCGDSLVGILDPSVIADGIPDEAYEVLAGDDRTVCSELKKHNRQSTGAIQGSLFDQESLKSVRVAELTFEEMPEETLVDISAKRGAWETAQNDVSRLYESLRADLYVSAFFAPKTSSTVQVVPTNEDLGRLARGMLMRPGVESAVENIAQENRFFHWHVSFAEIIQTGGFDVVIGNPPWELSQLQEQEYFAASAPSIAALTGAARKKAIARLPNENPNLWQRYQADLRRFQAFNIFVRESRRFDLAPAGRINLFALFTESFARLTSPTGYAGLIVPTGLATDYTNRRLFEAILENNRLVSLLGFDNQKRIFPSVHVDTPFCLLTVGTPSKAPEFAFYLLQEQDLSDKRRRLALSAADIALLNPNTRTAPLFRSAADAELTKNLYSRVPVLVNESLSAKGNPFSVEIRRIFNMGKADVVGSCIQEKRAGYVPMLEAKLIHQFDHRWATYGEKSLQLGEAMEADKRNSEFELTPRYWIEGKVAKAALRDLGWKRDWLLAWRDVTNATNERTMIACIIPALATDFTIRVSVGGCDNHIHIQALLANLNSIVLDYVARQKLGGMHMSDFISKQLPIIETGKYTEADLRFITARVVELSYTSQSIQPFARDLGYDGPPFAWDPARRGWLRAELDAYYARLYGLTRDELRYILDPADVFGNDYPTETFRVLKERETRENGEFRTAKLILEAWDCMESDVV